jgi:lysophospholipase L1-like esterase
MVTAIRVGVHSGGFTAIIGRVKTTGFPMSRLLALGDSYTIGEGVAESARWPEQFARLCNAEGGSIEQPVTVIAQTGWTSDELLSAIASGPPLRAYDLVSVLIGVNNQYRGWPLPRFLAELRQLLEIAEQAVSGRRGNIQVLSIPDWGRTPFGTACGRDLAVVSAEIDAFNHASRDLCQSMAIAWHDITELTRKHQHDPCMHAPDGLHPSGSMYALWAESLHCTGIFGRLDT